MNYRKLASAGLAVAVVALPSATQETAAGGPGHLLPTFFEENTGQFSDDVAFRAAVGRSTLFLTGAGHVLDLRLPRSAADAIDSEALAGAAIFTTFVDAGETTLVGEGELSTRIHYMTGSDRDEWSLDNHTFARVRVEGVWRGIDVVWRVDGGHFEYDFELAPGVDPDAIRMRIEGADDLSTGPDGELVMETAVGTVLQTIPSVYQQSDGGRVEVPGRFVVEGEGIVRFELGDHDRSLPLVIDPVLEWGTYLNADDIDETIVTAGVVADDLGHAFVAGSVSRNTTLPVTPGAYQTGHAGGPSGLSGYACKWSTDGSGLEWCTYVSGGAVSNQVLDLALLPNGELVLGGRFDGAGFPVTANGVDEGGNAWVSVLSADGSSLTYSSILNSGGNTSAVATDANGRIYIATDSYNVTTGAYLRKLDPVSGAVDWSTFLVASSGERWIRNMEVDSQGRVYISASVASSSSLPTPGGYLTTKPGFAFHDFWLGRLSADGTTIEYGTYFPVAPHSGFPDCCSNVDQNPPDIRVDDAGRVWLASYAESSFTPTLPVPFAGGPHDLVVACFDLDLAGAGSLLWSTFFGGGADESGGGLTFADGRLIVSGVTSSSSLSTACAPYSGGGTDMVLAAFEPDDGSYLWHTLFGGEGSESLPNPHPGSNAYRSRIAGNALGQVFVTGQTSSTTGIATAGAFQTTLADDPGLAVFLAALDVTADAASEVARLGTPPNPNAFLPGQTSGPVIGATWDPVVDHTSFVTDSIADFALVTSGPLNLPLGPEGTLLCDLVSLLAFVVSPAPGAPFALPVADKCPLVGITVCAQAGSIDGGGAPHLTNALDVTIGTH